MDPVRTDIAIVGAGAAGLAAAIFARRLDGSRRVLLVDGARRPGAKILVSGGGRCNVTNAVVTEFDFHGGPRPSIRRVLKALTVGQTVDFFGHLGVSLHEEALGKLFPDSHHARDVLEGLLVEAARVGVERLDQHRVQGLTRDQTGFVLETSGGDVTATRVILATGGQSLPKSGSDGAGFALARLLGHRIIDPVPALVPLVLDAGGPLAFRELAGITHDAEIAAWIDGRVEARVKGSLLWTHFGISGPAALDVSRHWTRGVADGHRVALTLAFCPGLSFEDADASLVQAFTARPRASVQNALTGLAPSAVTAAVLRAVGIDASQAAGSLGREPRRALSHALTGWPLPVTGTRGYNVAEVTAGGVALTEIAPATMESRVCPGLFFAGEVVDVDGRLGGFNFQWAWSSAYVAARGAAASLASHGSPNGETS